MPDTDKSKPVNLRTLDPADHKTLGHAAVDAGTNLTEYIRRLCHAEAERLRAKQNTSPATGHKFEFVISGMTAANAAEFWEGLVTDADAAGFELGGGYADEPPNT